VLQVRLCFGDYILDRNRSELMRGSDLVAIGPQAFDLLVHLVLNRDRVLSKEDLLQAIWGGRTVSDSTLTTHINAVRKAVGDSGEEQALIRTIPRKGYRFIGHVKDAPSTDRVVGDPIERDREPSEAAEPVSAPQIPNKPSIAVLAFQNLSGDPDQDYFADGVVEDIIAALSRLPSLFVIARNSSFTYKGRAVDVKKVGRELGVRYVLEGSVRRLWTVCASRLNWWKPPRDRISGLNASKAQSIVFLTCRTGSRPASPARLHPSWSRQRSNARNASQLSISTRMIATCAEWPVSISGTGRLQKMRCAYSIGRSNSTVILHHLMAWRPGATLGGLTMVGWWIASKKGWRERA
jgi:DNA-binding winged helix-turn-helix (wHTH) protein